MNTTLFFASASKFALGGLTDIQLITSSHLKGLGDVLEGTEEVCDPYGDSQVRLTISRSVFDQAPIVQFRLQHSDGRTGFDQLPETAPQFKPFTQGYLLSLSAGIPSFLPMSEGTGLSGPLSIKLSEVNTPCPITFHEPDLDALQQIWSDANFSEVDSRLNWAATLMRSMASCESIFTWSYSYGANPTMISAHRERAIENIRKAIPARSYQLVETSLAKLPEW